MRLGARLCCSRAACRTFVLRPVCAGEDVLDGGEVEDPEDLGLVDGALDVAGGRYVGEVQERAGDGGDGMRSTVVTSVSVSVSFGGP